MTHGRQSTTPETLQAQYAYDEAGQLVREDNAQLSQTVTYTYDKGGNITEKSVYPFTTGALGTATDTIAYTYDSTWKDKLTSYDGTTLTYDEIGDPYDYTHDRFFWWAARELRYAYLANDLTVEYRYNENGLRCLKRMYNADWSDSDDYYYFWSDDGRLLAYTVDPMGSADLYSVLVLYNSDLEPIGFTVDEDTYYYLKNIQGDVLCVTDAEGTPIVNYTYDAWGMMTVTAGAQTVSSQEVVRVAFLNPVTYRGYFYDYELGLYYLQSRYYDPETGRFITPDMYADTGMGLIGTNLYAYCINSPVCFTDYSGTKPRKLLYGCKNLGWYSGPQLSVEYRDGKYVVKYFTMLYLVIFKSNILLAPLSCNFTHNITVIDYVVKLELLLDGDSRQYWKNFCSKSSYDQMLIAGVIKAFKMHYNCSEMTQRTMDGLMLEFYLHLYAFYFQLDPNNHTSVIDFDTSESIGKDWWIYEYFDPTVFPFFDREKLINDLRLAVVSNTKMPALTAILKTVLSLV